MKKLIQTGKSRFKIVEVEDLEEIILPLGTVLKVKATRSGAINVYIKKNPDRELKVDIFQDLYIIPFGFSEFSPQTIDYNKITFGQVIAYSNMIIVEVTKSPQVGCEVYTKYDLARKYTTVKSKYIL
jgi:hypothetical protein